MAGVSHHCAGDGDGMGEVLDERHRTDGLRFTIHDPGIHLHPTSRGEHGAETGIEGGIVLHVPDSGFHRIQGGTARNQRLPADLRCPFAAGLGSVVVGRIDVSSTAVDKNGKGWLNIRWHDVWHDGGERESGWINKHELARVFRQSPDRMNSWMRFGEPVRLIVAAMALLGLFVDALHNFDEVSRSPGGWIRVL